MQHFFSLLALAAMTLLGLPSNLLAQTANVQIIHNSADPAAASVDIYIDGGSQPVIEDLDFRAATPFLALPAGAGFSVGVAPGNSSGPADILASFPIPALTDGENYVVMATGVLDPSNFDQSANGGDIAFTLEIFTPARTAADDASLVDVAVYHGSTDAPAVDVLANNGTPPVIANISYGDFTGGYLSLPPAEYFLSVTPAGANQSIVATFQADLSGLAGGAGIVFASGFLDPSKNQGGAAFGLFAALADGNVVALPAVACDLEILSFSLIDANTNEPIAGYDPIMDGAMIDLDDLPGHDINISANTCTGFPIGSVKFELSGSDHEMRVENKAPYALFGDNNGHYNSWGANGPNAGDSFTLSATAYSGSGASGHDGMTKTINFSFKGATPPMADAMVQVIHNAADPAAEVVDIYLNGGATPAIDDFTFRTATPFIALPSNTALDIGVAPGNSSGPADIIATFPVAGLAAGEKYVVMATGVLDPTQFDTTANGSDIAFTLKILTPAQTAASGSDVDIAVYHGATDAPAVDLLASYTPPPVVSNISYGNFTAGYLSLPPAAYTVSVTPAGANNTIVASYAADISGLGGGAGVAFASGFLNPANNQQGAAFGLFVALADGTVIELPLATCDLDVLNYTLIDADTDQPVAGYDPIPEGAEIDLDALASDHLNIRANVCPDAHIGSVKMELSGSGHWTQVENMAPYALFKDRGGDYMSWMIDGPDAGDSYTLKGTAYSDSHAQGTAGSAKMLNFSFIDSSHPNRLGNSDVPVLRVYPNPSQGKFVLEVDNWDATQSLTLKVLDANGRQVWIQNTSNTFPMALDLKTQGSGFYFIQLQGDDFFLTEKILIQN